MTYTLVAPARTSTARLGVLLCGVAAGPLFLAAGAVQGLTREGFDFGRNALSQLALGEAGWVQTLNFLVVGALLLACAAGLHRNLGGRRGGPVLVGVFGLSFWAAAAFPADAGAGFPAGAPDAAVMTGAGAAHMAAGMIGYLALCAAFFVLARPLADRGHRTWAVASRVVPVVVFAGFLASAASVLAFTAGAALGLLWLSAVTYRLAGSPVTN
ncbi:hypothetical protein GCM10010329_30620 [Streptomyces spiroverticillatus]|uniref:DUF998 domain-containing protein n=1 Tax=Streptomyces finlayi TaxID=67296 RepID=A0A918WWB5_9ACTN|nr:DUF998 domain-containing protein [Streptomyces finlayi]GHA05984.1 hypothetical protein GCM10010329_30620 [Streptomyces spiroverticillatus]GHC89668.1 hypothetical protein GCM10010334_23030 [Streptomyces finlayi]